MVGILEANSVLVIVTLHVLASSICLIGVPFFGRTFKEHLNAVCSPGVAVQAIWRSTKLGSCYPEF